MNNEHSKSHNKNHQHGKVSYLDNPKRRGELSPEQLLSKIPLKEGGNVLDFGAGTGYFSIPFAEKTAGTVYALDIDDSMLEIIKSKAQQKQLTNIVPVQGKIGELPLPERSIDVVIASLVLHEINPLAETLNQIKNVLKEDGYLICVELEPKGHSAHKAPRISSEGMEQEIIDAGLRITEKLFPAESLYVLIAQK